MSDLKQELDDLGGDFTDALEEIHLPAALLDADGIVRWQNRSGIALSGRGVGRRFFELVAPGEEAVVHDVLTRIVSEGKPAEFTLRVRDVADRLISVQVSAVPVRDGGSVVGIFGIGHDRRPEVATGVARAGSGLTPRQREVLLLLADGRSTAEIASLLHLSPTTVRNYIAGILAAFGVHTRLQAVVAASRAGLL